MAEQRCPVCEGRGLVPAGFYSPGIDLPLTSPENCRRCDGLGTIEAGERKGDYGAVSIHVETSPPDFEAIAARQEAAEPAVPTFTDSAGIERPYKVKGVAVEDLTEDDMAEYRAWWETQVKANAANHAKPIVMASAIDYDALG